MTMHLYEQLAPWYHLIDPVEDHEDEGQIYSDALARVITGKAKTLLELGSGAGNLAYFLNRHFSLTLTDLSDTMLDLSRAQNPECEHIIGDMRDLRLQRTFDAVLVHDAIVYMTTEEELRAAMVTAFMHTRPGGGALFAPDHLVEAFAENVQVHRSDSGSRSLRCLEWMWDPDPNDSLYQVEYSFMLRDGDQMQVVHDRHVEGLFSRSTWHRLLEDVGFEVESVRRPVPAGETDEVFLCRRP